MKTLRIGILLLILFSTSVSGFCQDKTEEPPQLQIYKVNEVTVLDPIAKQVAISYILINESYIVFLLGNEEPHVIRITETAIRKSGNVDFGVEYTSDGKVGQGKMIIQLKGNGIAHFVLYENETAKLLLVSKSSRFYPDEFALGK